MATGNIYVKTSQSMPMLVDRQPDSFPIPFPKSVGFHTAIRRGFWAVLKFLTQHLRERPASLAGPLSGPRGMVLGHEMTGDQTRANHAVAHLADGSIFFDRESS